MNINYDLIKELKDEVKGHYDKKEYDKAVTKGLYLLNSTLKRKHELELDKVELIDYFLKHRIAGIFFESANSDLDIDSITGILLFLKGLYEKVESEEKLKYEFNSYSKDDAEMILMFISYIMRKIDSTK